MIAGALALVLAPSAAMQQTEMETGSHISRVKPADIPEESMSPADRGRMAAVEFGDCLVARSPASVVRATAPFPTTAEANEALQRLGGVSECLRAGELRMPGPAIRGALFIGLYRHEFLRKLPPPLTTAAQVDFAEGAPEPRDERATQAIALRVFADCAARLDPSDARTTVIAPVGSRAETAAYAGLSPHLGACLPQGHKIVFSKTILQALFAEVLYRDAQAAPTASAK